MPSYGDMLRELREALQQIKKVTDGPTLGDPLGALSEIERICTKALEVPPTRTPK